MLEFIQNMDYYRIIINVLVLAIFLLLGVTRVMQIVWPDKYRGKFLSNITKTTTVNFKIIGTTMLAFTLLAFYYLFQILPSEQVIATFFTGIIFVVGMFFLLMPNMLKLAVMEMEDADENTFKIVNAIAFAISLAIVLIILG